MNKLDKVGMILTALGAVYLVAVLAAHQSLVAVSQQKVVKISIVAAPKGHWIGSGAIISPDGLILTCGHLFARNVAEIDVITESGQTYVAHLVRVDHAVDLAVIKIDAVKALPYFHIGADPYIGERVIAFGSPLDIQGTVTFGYVENLNGGPSRFTIQGCPINPGNSGGPLVDYHGNLVGVNVAIMVINPFQMAQGLNLAVNLGTIREFIRN